MREYSRLACNGMQQRAQQRGRLSPERQREECGDEARGLNDEELKSVAASRKSVQPTLRSQQRKWRGGAAAASLALNLRKSRTGSCCCYCCCCCWRSFEIVLAPPGRINQRINDPLPCQSHYRLIFLFVCFSHVYKISGEEGGGKKWPH